MHNFDLRSGNSSDSIKSTQQGISEILDILIGSDNQEDANWSVSKLSPRMKRPVQRRDNSLEPLSVYSSPGGVSIDTSPIVNVQSPDLGICSMEDKQAAKRRLFNYSPAKVQPKKQKVPPLMHPSSVSQEEFDENLILLD